MNRARRPMIYVACRNPWWSALTTSPRSWRLCAACSVNGNRERVDVLITDQRMPDMTGTELLQRVAEQSPTTHRLMLTGYPDSDLFIECLRFGIRRLISKPWKDEDLRLTVLELLRAKC